MGEERLDRFAITLHHIEDAVGKPGRVHELGQEKRRGGVLLGGLEDEGIPTGDGVGQHPHRHHDREIERGDPGHDTERLVHGMDIDTAGHLGRVGSLEEVGYAAGELDVLQSPGHFAGGITQHLAVLGGDEGSELVRTPVHELAEAKERSRSRAQ